MNEVAPKRFYKNVAVRAVEGGWGIFLDERQARTMKRAALTAQYEPLANAIAGEWSAQGEHIDRSLMPLTGLLSAAIDGGRDYGVQCRDEIISYLGSDLICYRADHPPALVERQEKIWGAYLDWLRCALNAPLTTVTGIMAVEQPDHSLAAVRTAIDNEPTEKLLAMRIITNITGSGVLALALWKDAFTREDIFEASRLDERFQAERWGVDEEAKARDEIVCAEFNAVADFLDLL